MVVGHEYVKQQHVSVQANLAILLIYYAMSPVQILEHNNMPIVNQLKNPAYLTFT